MKTTTNSDYIEIFCKPLCANYNTCDKTKMHKYITNSKTECIKCSAYKKKEANNENETRGDMVL